MAHPRRGADQRAIAVYRIHDVSDLWIHTWCCDHQSRLDLVAIECDLAIADWGLAVRRIAS